MNNGVTELLNKKLLVLHGILSALFVFSAGLMILSVMLDSEAGPEKGSLILAIAWLSALAFFHVKALLDVGKGNMVGRKASRVAGWLQCLNPIGWYVLYLSYYQYKASDAESPTL